MAILASCSCGQSFDLKDEYAGQLMQCPKCGGQFQAGAAAPPLLGDPIFGRDKFLLRQKHFAISEKYFVWDEEGRTIMYVVRPAHLARNLLAALVGVFAAVVTLLLCFAAAAAVGDLTNQVVGGTLGILSFVVAGIVLMLVASALSKKRHVQFYQDELQQELLLEVKQDQKLVFLNATFTLLDAQGQLLGHFQKNYLYNIFRKRWRFFSPQGILQYVAKEDSIILSLLRRLLGPLFGLLRTNYIILDADERLLGEFNRKFTLLDRYVLDMTHDAARSMDRRIAVALGVMLDTGERR